jgi:hypothetical protein
VETVRSQDVTWFRPLWRRLAVIGFLVVWLAWELLWTQDRLWGVLVGAILAYSLYRFFYAFPKDDAADGGEA